MDTRLTLVESAAKRQLEIVSWGACCSASGKKKTGSTMLGFLKTSVRSNPVFMHVMT